MNHRISSGGIVVVDNRVLLVRHCLPGRYDFWVAPGGGIEPQEDIFTAAVREVKEETGLIVEPVKPVYLEQFHQPDVQHMKTWVLCQYKSGDIFTSAQEATREHIVEGAFVSEAQMAEESKPVFPEVLGDEFWRDLASGFPDFRYLGQREMAFY